MRMVSIGKPLLFIHGRVFPKSNSDDTGAFKGSDYVF